jgi:ribosomal-protein-alanine N-acetyltransferase
MTVDGYLLRPLAADDLAAMTALDARCFDPGWNYPAEVMADSLLTPGAHALGFFHGPALVGFVLWVRGEIVTLDVAPEHRRQGLGRRLMQAALRAIRQSGRRRAALDVDRDNAAAIALYRTLGFAVEREFREGGRRRLRMTAPTDSATIAP